MPIRLIIGAVFAAPIVAMLGIPKAAGAQDIRAYIGGAAMVSAQGSHRQGSAPSLPTTGAGGTAAGVTVEAGTFLTRHAALGIEVSLPHRFTSVQEVDYLRVFQLESRHRDMTVSGLVRGMAGSAGGVRLGFVGGGGFVQESTRQRRRDQEGSLAIYPPAFGPYSTEYSFSRWTIAALAGVDVEIAITPRVAVVPQMRAHFVRRSSDPSQPGWALGLSSLIVRPGIGVRATF